MSDRNDKLAEHALDLRGERLQLLDDIRYLIEEGFTEAAGQALLKLGTELRYEKAPGKDKAIAFTTALPAPF